MDEFNIQDSIKRQKEYCDAKGVPHFAPYDGRCHKCGGQIYSQKERYAGGRKYFTGINTEKAGTTLVTGCPHCNYSFCD